MRESFWGGGEGERRLFEILVKQQSPHGVFVCDDAGLVINRFSISLDGVRGLLESVRGQCKAVRGL